MKKLIAILVLSLSLILCLTACGSKMPYDLSGTASVELHAYNNDSTEPFAKIGVDGEDVATIVEMFNSLKLKEMKYTEPSICGYEFWFRDENGSEIVKIELPYGPSPWLVVGGTEYPYQDVNGGVDVDYLLARCRRKTVLTTMRLLSRCSISRLLGCPFSMTGRVCGLCRVHLPGNT